MPNSSFDYQKIVDSLLAKLPKERDRDVLARRYGLGSSASETLDKIGRRYGVTRERVRQVERAALKRLAGATSGEMKAVNQRLAAALAREGGVAELSAFSGKLGAETPTQKSQLYFLARLAPDIEIIDENKELETTLFERSAFSAAKLTELSRQLAEAFKRHGKPARLTEIAAKLPAQLSQSALGNLASVSKSLSNFGQLWGLKTWPAVNPKSIKDRAYLALAQHSEPLHFSAIAIHIEKITPSGRKVTTQAVHNELIKDERFILIGRGIYALSDWGYTAGTVADMIKEVLREEQPLHKDEIVRRVLLRRQVKQATIALNLQEKDHFERVAKATYQLKHT